jgi:hypothetical protein
LNIPFDRQHVLLASKLSDAMHTSEPIVISADGVTADAFVDDFEYKS